MDVRWLTDEEQEVWRAFIGTFTRLMADLDAQLQRDAGMPNAYYGILVALSEAPQRSLRMSELAQDRRGCPSMPANGGARRGQLGQVRLGCVAEHQRGTWAA